MDRSADHRDPPTAEWPSITDYWPDDSPAQAPAAPASPVQTAPDDGLTWIGPSEAAADPARRRLRVALGGLLAAALLVVTGGVLASLIKQAHEPATTAEPVLPPSADTFAAPLGPTGAASVAPAPSSTPTSASPSATASPEKVTPLVLPAAATFELATGSPSVTLQTRDLGTQLYHVSIANGATGDPEISDSGSAHRLTVTHDGKGVLVPLAITLNAKVHWTVRMTGGITKNVLDFRDSDVTAIELAEGASSTRLTLPPATGTLPVRITHGVHNLQIITDQDDPVRAEIRAGSSKVVLLGRRHDGVSKGAVLTSPGWNEATNRIDLIATGGIGALTVTAD